MSFLQPRSPLGVPVRAALLTPVCLGAGVASAFPPMLALNTAAPALADEWGRPIFFLALLAGCFGGALVWARLLARLAGSPDRGRVALAGALGFGVSTPLAVYGLAAAETALLVQAQNGPTVPMHLAFGALFTGGVFAVVLVTGLAMGLAARARWRATRLALRAAGTAAAGFAAVDVTMDLVGWRVGGPHAEERFTMLVVFALGLLAASLAGGAALGHELDRLAGSPGRDVERGPGRSSRPPRAARV